MSDEEGWIAPAPKRAKISSPSSKAQAVPSPSDLVAKLFGKRIVCKFNDQCYRRNADHLFSFRHPVCKPKFLKITRMVSLLNILNKMRNYLIGSLNNVVILYHPVETIYKAMEDEDDFTKVPESLIPEDRKMDERIVIEQAEILKQNGFKTSLGDCGSRINSEVSPPQYTDKKRVYSDNESPPKKADVPACSSSNPAVKMSSSHGGITMTVEEKWNASCPFNFFLTKIEPSRNKESPGFFSICFAGT